LIHRVKTRQQIARQKPDHETNNNTKWDRHNGQD